MSLKFLAIVWLISSKHVKTSDSFIFGGQIECDDPNLRMLSFFWRETVGGNVGDSLIRCEGKSVDFYIIKRTLHRNVTKATAQFIKTHQEKLKNLSRSTSLKQTYSSADITWRNSGASKECMMICTIRTGIVNYIEKKICFLANWSKVFHEKNMLWTRFVFLLAVGMSTVFRELT